MKDNKSDKNKPSSEKIKNYAESFLKMAEAGSCADKFEEEFYELKNALNLDLDLKTVLSDNSIEKPERIKIAFSIIGRDASLTLRAVTSVIITMDLVEYIEDIFSEFTNIINIKKKQLLVEVVSSIKLDEEILKKIKQSIDDKTGKDTRLKNIIDDTIIGGIIIKLGEKVIDLSVKGKLKDLKSRLKSLDLGGA